MRVSKILQKPVVTEKSLAHIEALNMHHFKVHLKATKRSIANAVENMFGVDVVKVTTLTMPGKKRRIGKTRRFTKTAKWKKAIVTIKEGQEIKYD